MKAIHTKERLLAASIAIFVSLTGGSSGATILNPSFETPDIPSAGYSDTDPTDWIVTEPVNSSQVKMFDRIDLPAHEGSQMVGFNVDGSPGGATIHQPFITLLGTTYEVSFWAMRFVGSTSSLSAEIFDGAGMGGTSLASVNGNVLTGSFTQTTFSFTATSTTTTIAFIDTTVSSVTDDLFLDDIEIAAVPEPSSMLLIGLGILGLTSRRSRR